MGKTLSQEETDEKRIEVKFPVKLIERIQRYCRKQNMSMDNFILDAVTAKLYQANQERRKRQRL